MEKGKRVCKICGEEYPFCATKSTPNKFRWQDVACCVEHAEEYLKKIEEARNGNTGNAQPLQQEDLVSAIVPAEPQIEEQSESKAELETKEIDDERNNKTSRRKRRRK